MEDVSFTLTALPAKGQWLIFVPWNGTKIPAGTLFHDDGAWYIHHVSDAVYGRGEDGMSLTIGFVKQFMSETTLDLSAFTSGIRGQGKP